MSLPYYKRFPRDFLEGTIGLSFESKGAYAIVLDLIYMRDGILPDDARYIAGQLGCSVRKWSAILADLVKAGKLQVQCGIISNFRADYLTEESRRYQDNQAKIAGKPRKNKSLRQPEPSQSEEEEEEEEKKEQEPTVPCPPKPSNSTPDDFQKAWKAYPTQGRQRSKSQAKTLPIWRQAAKAAGGSERLAAAVARYVREDQTHKGECGPPAFDRWLRDGRWEHWLPDANAPNGAATMSPELQAQRRALLMGDAANA